MSRLNQFFQISLNTHYSSISTHPLYLPNSRRQTSIPKPDFVSEFHVFKHLDKLQPTSTGPDDLPAWFLRLAAPIMSKSLTHLINLSLAEGIVPLQWKSAVN